MVERYSGHGRLADGGQLPDQPVAYHLDVWEQFLGGLGGRYKVEGRVELERPSECESTATLILEGDIRIRARVFADGRVLGDAAPQFARAQAS